MKRREFFLYGTAVLAALPALGCGDDDDGDTAGTGGSGTGGSGTGGAETGGSGTGGGETGGSDTGGAATGGGGGAAGACQEDIETDSSESDGHVHQVEIPLEDIRNATAGTFTLELADGHTHEIELTVDDMNALQGGQVVMKTSTITLSHNHDVVLTCLLDQ
jgi:hypothetical protein